MPGAWISATSRYADRVRWLMIAMLGYSPPAETQAPRTEKVFDARIIRIEVRGSASVVTFAAGKDRGIDRHHAHAVLIDRDKPVAYGNCPIERVMERTSQCLLTATFDQIRAFTFVRVTLD
jgi:hypothetical protein